MMHDYITYELTRYLLTGNKIFLERIVFDKVEAHFICGPMTSIDSIRFPGSVVLASSEQGIRLFQYRWVQKTLLKLLIKIIVINAGKLINVSSISLPSIDSKNWLFDLCYLVFLNYLVTSPLPSPCICISAATSVISGTCIICLRSSYGRLD